MRRAERAVQSNAGHSAVVSRAGSNSIARLWAKEIERECRIDGFGFFRISACGRRACKEAESMGSVIMFMRPDFTSAILFLCELFFWLKDVLWLQRMCALMKQLGERVPAILPG